MIIRPTQLYYEVHGDKSLNVYVCGRGEDLKRKVVVIKDTKPHFYVPAGEKAPDSPDIVSVELGASVTLKGSEPVDRITVKYPFNVPALREHFTKTYEADIVYGNRVRYDLGIKNYVEVPDDKREILSAEVRPIKYDKKISPRVVVFDIETNSDKGNFVEPKYPTAPVVSIAAWDSYTDKYVVIFYGQLQENDRIFASQFFKEMDLKVQVLEVQNEAELFSAWRKFLHTVQCDVLAGWNNIGYDLPYLKERARTQRFVEPNWKEFGEFDLMLAYERLHEGELESKALNFVSQELGMKGKSTKKKIFEMMEDARGELVAYNVNDVFLTKEIMLKKNLVDFFLELVSFAGCGIEDALLTGRLVDSYMFHRLKGICVQPTKEKAEWDAIPGAKVFEASKGIFKNVVEVDNSGEYASIIRTFNLSPETKITDGVWPTREPHYMLPSGRKYRKEPRGEFPKALDELTIERAEKKRLGLKDEERVVKEFALTFYGVLASPGYRNADPDIGADITDVARRHLDWNKDHLEACGGKLIYGDTDSCLATYSDKASYEEVDQWAKGVVTALNESFPRFASEYGAEECFLSIKHERTYTGFLQSGARKRYACIYKDPKGDILHEDTRYSLKIRGFEVRRTNSAPITRVVQKEIFKRLLLGAGKEEIKDYLIEIIAQLKDGRIPTTECAIPTSITKVDYGKTLPMHVRAARWSNKWLGYDFRSGSKPRLIHGRVKSLPSTDVFSIEWGDPLPKNTVIDWSRTIEKVIIMPMSPILETIDLYPEEIISADQDVVDFF